ncbi:MAG: M15 family metallopeptidase [Pseudohongiellaceae bacterium]
MELPENIKALHIALGIPEDFMDSCNMAYCPEPETLVATERDFYDREQKLTPHSFRAWRRMKEAAAADEVPIFLISAYRSIQYQYELILKKLDSGASIRDVLAVNAAPGFSEHHTGRAVDIGTLSCPALVEEFDKTLAFQWLRENAKRFGFNLSYPRGNSFGIIYEPWHWCFQEDSGSFDLTQDQP